MEGMTSYIIIGAISAAFIVLMLLGSKRRKEEAIKKMLSSYGSVNKRKYDHEQMMCIPHYFGQHRKGHFTIDDITWNDLDMDKIFMMLDVTNSSAGQEYLYSALRTPYTDKEKLEERERVISYLDKADQDRAKLQTEFFRLGFTRRISIFDYLSGFMKLEVKLGPVRYLPIILFVASIALMFVHVSFGMLAFIAMLITNVLLYFNEKASIDSYFVCTAYIARLVKCARNVSELDIKALESYLSDLKKASADLRPIIRRARFITDPRAVSGSISDTVLEYVNMILHIDLLMFYRSLDLVKKNTDSIGKIIKIIGELETDIAIGNFRRTLPFYCTPEFTDKNRRIKAVDIYHPSIAEPVSNCIDEEKSILLTGSNASGKSTFLKTVAINSILAQTVHTCMAHELEIPIVRLMTSMSLRDDLESGDSYYIVEIKALKRILDEAAREESCPVLCMVDEVLRGTNTVERIAASSQVLKKLDEMGVFVFTATHDIELTYMLEGTYANYHFSEEVKEDDVYFSYILHKGRATTRNAIRLLGIMGYDEKTIEAAEKSAAYFAETGEWKL
jgi:DNA mismatch repair ATPase MutS